MFFRSVPISDNGLYSLEYNIIRKLVDMLCDIGCSLTGNINGASKVLNLSYMMYVPGDWNMPFSSFFAVQTLSKEKYMCIVRHCLSCTDVCKPSEIVWVIHKESFRLHNK